MKAINAIRMGGVDVLPLVEGGKGVAISNGVTAGHWASQGGAGGLEARVHGLALAVHLGLARVAAWQGHHVLAFKILRPSG